MKSSSKKMLTAVSMLLLASCGGGGGSGSSSTSLAEVNAETINRLGSNMATATPGCDYTSASVATAPYPPETIALYRSLINTIKQPARAARQVSRESSYSDTLAGDCGGSVVIAGEHDEGDDDLSVTFSNYCTTGDTASYAVANGSMRILVDGTPSDSGPVVEEVGISTGSSGISVVSTVDGVSSTNRLEIDDLEVGLDQDDPGDYTLRADRIKVVDNGQDFMVTDLSMALSDDSGSSVMSLNSVTYHDPDVGAVRISISDMPLESSGAVPATITLSGSDGSEATFTSNDFESGLFTAKDADGNIVGAIDCSDLASGI